MNAVSKGPQTCFVAMVGFIITALTFKYAQVVIWKRVKEINEDLLERVILRAVWSVSLLLICFADQKLEMLEIYSFFSGEDVNLTFWSSVDKSNPLSTG